VRAIKKLKGHLKSESLAEGGMWWTGKKESERTKLINTLVKELNC
jgi:hypothetical protein